MTALVAGSRGASLDDWTRFMRPVAASVRNPPTEIDFKARVAAIAHAIAVPAEWLRQPWRQTEAMRRFQFWPAVFDVAEMFADDLRAAAERAERQEQREHHAALPPPAEPGLTPAQREQMAATMRSLAASLQANAAPAAGVERNARPMPISDGALLAHYDRMAAEGNRAAATRAALLRARLEAV